MPSFSTPHPITVSIDIAVGEVRLVASERADTAITVTPTNPAQRADIDAAEKIRIDFSNDRLVIAGPRSKGIGTMLSLGRPGSLRIDIELPAGSELQAEGAFVDFGVDGPLGDVKIETSAGGIVLDQVGNLHARTSAGRVTASRADGMTDVTAAGEVRLGEITGDASVRNLNGRTWIGTVAGNVKVRSANGNVSVDRALGDVAVRTANGSIEIGEVTRGLVTLDTSLGGIDIGIPQGSAAWLDLSTKFGHLANSLGGIEAPDHAEQTIEIRGRTSFGDIVVHTA